MSLKATPMSDVTRILSEIEQGDPSAAEQLLPLVYEELRKLAAQKMAGESPDHTLQATLGWVAGIETPLVIDDVDGLYADRASRR